MFGRRTLKVPSVQPVRSMTAAPFRGAGVGAAFELDAQRARLPVAGETKAQLVLVQRTVAAGAGIAADCTPSTYTAIRVFAAAWPSAPA